MKKLLLGTCLSFVIGIALAKFVGYGSGLLAMRQVAAAGKSPYTLRLREVIKAELDKPGHISQELIIAQRSDGVRVEKQIILPEQAYYYQTRKIRRIDGSLVTTADDVGLRNASPPMPADVLVRYNLSRPNPTSNCLVNLAGKAVNIGYTVVGTEEIGGLRTVKISREQPHRMVSWLALDLECQEVQRYAGFRGCCNNQPQESDPVTNTSELSLVSYLPGEPDSSLFEFESLREVPLRQLTVAMLQRAGWTPDQIDRALNKPLAGC